jgi:signal transduction histidine kinase
MDKSINQKFKKNILILTIIITFIFVVINISLYIINNNYLTNKVNEENTAFLQITTHIINENDVEIALEYIEHYTHIHKVNIEVLDENQVMVFSSNVAHLYTSQYQIETTKGNYTVFIDNTDSVTVNAIESNTIYFNVLLLVIYLLAMFVLIRINKRNAMQIDQDISNVLKLIKNEKTNKINFNHQEFEHIHQVITSYLEDIDLLTEQKEMNMKGLAHDIKTPLTIIYSYFDRINKNVIVSDEDIKSTFDASVRINDLLNDIIEDKKRQSNKEINISRILVEKQKEYSQIFLNKDITIISEIEPDITVLWSEKDFTRVIDNLISNAYYYSDKESIFEITAKKDKKILIEFTSKPIDITSVNPSIMFKKGYRGTASDEINKYGKGYGLYICRLLLQTIDGEIESSIINENVKFTIIL